MILPPDLHGIDVVIALRRLGFSVSRQTELHVILKRGSRKVVVPQSQPIKPGTARGVMEQAGHTVEELARSL